MSHASCSGGSQSEMTDAVRQVAAFDFDGTITRADTLGPFLARVAGRARLYRSLLLRSPVLAATFVGIADRDAEKERLCGRLLAGRAAQEVTDAGIAYAAELLATRAFRNEMLDRIAWHDSEGHEVVVVSASLNVYLEPLACDLGIDHVICTSLEVDSAETITGKLVGGNVRGEEKARRLQTWLGDGPRELWAYGNSKGDRELLAMANYAEWV